MNDLIENNDENILENDLKNNGKAVFALYSLLVTEGCEKKKGYLLFKNPDAAIEIIKMCQKELQNTRDNPDRGNNFGKKSVPIYKPYQWINVNDFYHGNISARGSFFVTNLDNCCENIFQDQSLNFEKNHAIFTYSFDVAIGTN